MQLIHIPASYRKVDQDSFEEFLATCPDYLRTGYVGAVEYRWRSNDKPFAVVMQRTKKVLASGGDYEDWPNEEIWVDEKLLA